MAGHMASQDSVGDGPPETRQRLRPWLIHQLNSKNIPGLEWIGHNIFKIPWKHGGKQDWDPAQAQIFKEWAVHTGKFRERVDAPNYAKWKTNLRCALNKAPDIQEIPEQTRKDEPNPYKVYKFLEKKKRGSIPINVPSEGQHQNFPTDGAVVPTFVTDYSSSGSCPSGKKPEVEPLFNHSPAGVRPVAPHDGRFPSDLDTMDSGDLIHMSDGGPRLSDALTSQENMEFEEAATINGNFSNTSPTSQCSYETTPQSSPYQLLVLPVEEEEAKYTEPWFTVQDPGHQQVNTLPVCTQPPATHTTTHTPLNEPMKLEMLPANSVPFDSLRPSHACRTTEGCDMYLEILYRNHIINTYHISSRNKGCRITHKTVPNLTDEALPDLFRDALFGPDSAQRQVVELPEWPGGLCPDTLLPSIRDLLRNMQRGLILECKHGDIQATRLCKTTVYYSSSFTSDTTKLERHDNSILVTKIFDMENHFKPALTKYDKGEGERPSPYVYLYIGQHGSESDLRSLLIVVRLTSCRALQLISEVDEQRCHAYSMHMSVSNEYDHLGDCVTKQLQDSDN